MRLHCIVEGQTEETFANDILAMHLATANIATDVRSVMTSRRGTNYYRGGLVSYQKARFDLTLWMKQDKADDVRFTTMFDFYALPNDFPGYKEASIIHDPYQKISIIETALSDDIADHRFIPYIQLHEFEALLFVDIKQLDWAFIDHNHEIEQLEKLALKYGNPELINEHPTTAPSKRIIDIIPEYRARKVSAGPLVAGKIGTEAIRNKCRHFDEWLKKLEALK